MVFFEVQRLETNVLPEAFEYRCISICGQKYVCSSHRLIPSHHSPLFKFPLMQNKSVTNGPCFT